MLLVTFRLVLASWKEPILSSQRFTAASSEQPQKGTLEQIKAHRELKRRKELLKATKLSSASLW